MNFFKEFYRNLLLLELLTKPFPPYRLFNGMIPIFSLYLCILAYPISFQEKQSADLVFSEKDTVYQLYLEKITLVGNKRTKQSIIYRELDIRVGDSLPSNKLDTILFRNRNKIFNTDLFTIVDLRFQKDSLSQALNLIIQVQERFYTFPIPIFELADRNFNEWYYERGADLNRTNYGMSLSQKNIFGRNQTLTMLAQMGFVRRFNINYAIPYIDKKQKWGIGFGLGYIQNKSLAYRTEIHKLKYLSSEKILRERYAFALALRYRKGFYEFHTIEAKYDYSTINDTILELNPKYFLNSKTIQQYLTLRYEYRRDYRDVQAYPLRGYVFRFEIEKKGLGLIQEDLDILSFTSNYTYYKQLAKRLFVDIGGEFRYSILNQQPYSNAQGLGYNNSLLRGFELYVIDGQSYLLNKNTLKYRLFETRKTLKFIPIKQFRTIPLAMYFTCFFDSGYLNDRFFVDDSNRFSNRFLFGTGVGVDVVSYYNSVISLNYSMNVDMERGFFLSFNGKF